MIIKLGEASIISGENICKTDVVLSYENVISNFERVASLKKIAPKSKDFLYFSAIMMHAAEASLLNPNGTFKKDSSGKDLQAHWDKLGESWRWVCSDKNVFPLKNANGDIFPEEELLKAYKNWVGKPLCVDHKSASVDDVRGLIVDTYYDIDHKRIIALCALDKVSYPELAQKVATGYAASVSMGVGVGTAICTDCGKVAKSEPDFCLHMRNKTCYGEVNVGLKPIELSIVVNGADQDAKVYEVFASMNGNMKRAADETKDIQLATDIASGIDKSIEDLNALKRQVEELKGREETEQKESEVAKTDSAKPEEKSDANDSYPMQKLESMIRDLQNKFSTFQKSSEEHSMSEKKGYWQGGGGVNEPTPGKPKYEKEDSDSIRNTQDRQMVGPSPFPDVGPVDKMYPGTAGGETEEARKKRLQRLAAEQEERRMKREAAVAKAKENLAKKEGYFQGGGGVNEPTPGKPKYEKEDSDSIRNEEDKQMVGQPPFPDVGPVDKLHPSPASVSEKDELKRKQMLARAKLNAKFYTKSNADGSQNVGESRWMVFADKNLILDASVKEIANGQSKQYAVLATEGFGGEVIKMIRSGNFDQAAALFKSSQSMPDMSAAPAAPAVPPVGQAMNEPVAAGLGAPMEEPVDGGGTGDVVEQLPDLLDKTEKTLSEVRKGVNVLMDKDENKLEVSPEMSPTTASLIAKKDQIQAGLLGGMKQAHEDLQHLRAELSTANKIYQNQEAIKPKDAAYLGELVKGTISDTYKALAEARNLMECFVRYAKGTELVVKRAAKELEMKRTAQFAPSGLPGDPLDPTLPGAGSPAPQPVAPTAPKEVVAPPAKTPVTPVTPVKDELPAPYPRDVFESYLLNNARQPNGHNVTPTPPTHPLNQADDGADKEDENDADVKANPDGTLEGSPEDIGKAMKAKAATTREDRMALRAKLAEKGMMMSDLLQKAHPKGGTDLDLGSKDKELSHIETLDETHDAIMKVLNATPKVKKAAADIQKLVVAGKVDPSKDFPKLITAGLDPEAVKYWKKFWGEAKDGGSEFASELVKEHAAKRAAADRESDRVKVARAFEVAYEMVSKGMIGSDRHALKTQVDELMAFNDDGFDSMKRWVERQPSTKTASLPDIGRVQSVLEYRTEEAPASFKMQLEKAFSTAGNKRRY